MSAPNWRPATTGFATTHTSRNAAAARALMRVRRDVAPSGFSSTSPVLDYRTARLTLIVHVCSGQVLVNHDQLRPHLMATVCGGFDPGLKETAFM